MSEIDTFHVSQKLFIVNGKQELLILKDAHHPYHDFPGGRLNKDEFTIPLLESLRREVGEELGAGVVLTIREQIVAVARDCLWNETLHCLDEARHVFILFYEAVYRGGELILSNEHESYRWVSLQDFDPIGLFKPGTEQATRQHLPLIQ